MKLIDLNSEDTLSTLTSFPDCHYLNDHDLCFAKIQQLQYTEILSSSHNKDDDVIWNAQEHSQDLCDCTASN